MSSLSQARWGRWGVRARILAWKNVLAFRLHGRRRCSRAGSKVAIFKPDRLGDFTLALGAIRWILQRHGESQCVLFISPHASELAQREFPNVSRVVVAPFADELWPAWQAFKNQNQTPWWEYPFEIALSLRHQRTPWQELLYGRLNCRQRWALENRALGFHPIEQRWIRTPLSHAVSLSSANGRPACLELEAHRQLLEAAFGTDVSADDVVPRLAPPAGVQPSDSLLLCPFGSASLRTLPTSVVVAGIKEFRQQMPVSLRLAAAPAERARYEAYADELVAGGLPRPLVVPTPTIDALLAEMAGSRAVLSTESAPAHLAVALDRPAVILLGGGHHGLFAPWHRSARQIWLDHPLECYHCDWQCPYPEPYCLTKIAPSSLARALLNVIAAG